MVEPRELVLLTKAQQVLAQASSLDEVKQFRDKAAAVRAYAQKARLGKHLLMDAAALRIRAERRLGQMLKETNLADSAPGNQYTDAANRTPTAAVLLKELGITKNESARSQRIAEIADEHFEQYLAVCAQTEREPTFAGLLRLLRPHQGPPAQLHCQERNSETLPDGTELSIIGSDYTTVLSIPPWPGLVEPGTPALTTDILCNLPVVQSFAQQAHLYVWTNSRYLLDALDVMDAWGFAYHTSFVVVHDQAVPGSPWGNTHHFLLAGVRGDLRFRKNADRSWLACPSPVGGRVPNDITALIEAASPGPYLLLFANQDMLGDDWTHCPLSSNT
ncbi:MAG: methyltransferase-A70 family protein [Pirellulaceae bacterium]